LIPSSVDGGGLEVFSTGDGTTRFFIGGRSPVCYEPIVRKLAAALPDADVEVVPRQGHYGIARAPQQLVESLTSFLT
jgi:pimeloyl-ACP methyl ester carboxylesterase